MSGKMPDTLRYTARFVDGDGDESTVDVEARTVELAATAAHYRVGSETHKLVEISEHHVPVGRCGSCNGWIFDGVSKYRRGDPRCQHC